MVRGQMILVKPASMKITCRDFEIPFRMRPLEEDMALFYSDPPSFYSDEPFRSGKATISSTL